MSKSKKGFSLIELLVAMAIIAVLLGLVGFGISTAQRNSRDSQRRQKVADIKLVLEDYNTRKNAYPATNEITTTASIVTVGTGTDAGTVPLSGPTNALSTTQTDSTSSGTVYCYSRNDTAGGYSIGSKLESGSWYYANTDGTTPAGGANPVNCTRFGP